MDCLNPNKQRKTAGGFKFVFKKVWDENERMKNTFKSSLIQTLTSQSSLEDIIARCK